MYFLLLVYWSLKISENHLNGLVEQNLQLAIIARTKMGVEKKFTSFSPYRNGKYFLKVEKKTK